NVNAHRRASALSCPSPQY
ncbi:unnamed protein product, partial [Oikopleura dioica]